MDRKQVNVSTSAGSLTFSERQEPQVETTCGCCGVPTYAALEMEATAVDGAGETSRVRGEICGDCLAAALAITYGRAHLEHGGKIEDLAEPAGCEHVYVETQDRPRCAYCGRPA